MKLQLSFYSLVLGTLIIVSNSCAVDEGPFVEPSCEPEIPTEVSYSSDIQSIFNLSCVACHTESHVKLNLLACCSYVELTTTGFNAPYINTTTPTSSRLYKHLTGELLVMPTSGKLPDHQINRVLKWIEQGAKNN